MKSKVFKILIAIASAGILFGIGWQVFTAFYDPYESVTVKQGTYEKKVELSGYFVRDEKALTVEQPGAISYAYKNGERAARESELLRIYKEEETLQALEQLDELQHGRTVKQPVYSYLTCTRSATETVTVHPADIILVEGILIFTDARLRSMLDILVYVDADPDDRLVRVISRDIIERGRDVGKVIERYERVLKPMHLQFIEPTKRYADLILPQGGHNQVGIDMLIATIENHLKNS